MNEIRCFKCHKKEEVEQLSSFDVMSLPNGKEVVRKRFNTTRDTSMCLVLMCNPCYDEVQGWVDSSAKGVVGR